MSVDQFLLSANTTDLNYPEIRPSLDLNFARTKTLDPRITFTRASGGSYVGADGLIKYAGVNEARFDHDLETGESLGLLVEESRSNIWVNSNRWGQPIPVTSPSNINNGKLFTTTGVIYDAGIAPDGTNTAMQLGPGNCTASMYGVTEPATICTFSTFIKRIGNTSSVTVRSYTSLNFDITFNFNTETLSVGYFPSYVAGSAGFKKYPNGWYRIWFTYDRSLQSGGGTLWPVVDGSSSTQVFLWGAQKEAGNFPTSYIPTQSTSRTRTADNASITGKNFSDFYKQGTGTIFSNFSSVGSLSNNRIVYAISDNIFNNSMYLIPAVASAGNQTIQAIILNGSSDGSLSSLGGVYRNYSFVKTAFAFENKNSAFVIDRRDVSKNFTAGIPTVNRIYLGASWVGGGNFLNGHISRLTYYPKRLPNSQLQALTR